MDERIPGLRIENLGHPGDQLLKTSPRLRIETLPLRNGQGLGPLDWDFSQFVIPRSGKK